MTSAHIKELVESFYTDLERLSDKYEELMDTDVRETLHMTLNYFFVWGERSLDFPITYGMFSLEGDRAISNAVNKFLSLSLPKVSDIPVGKERLALLQDFNIKTPNGNQYDEFIGHSDEPLPPDPLPEDLFEEGFYDD